MTEPLQRPLFTCHYKDGTKRHGTYLETLKWFNEALNTTNPCSITAPHQEYNAP